jgi:hypothetical protein
MTPFPHTTSNLKSHELLTNGGLGDTNKSIRLLAAMLSGQASAISLLPEISEDLSTVDRPVGSYEGVCTISSFNAVSKFVDVIPHSYLGGVNKQQDITRLGGIRTGEAALGTSQKSVYH